MSILGVWIVVGNCAFCGAPIFARELPPPTQMQGDVAPVDAPLLPEVRWTCGHQSAKKELRKFKK